MMNDEVQPPAVALAQAIVRDALGGPLQTQALTYAVRRIVEMGLDPDDYLPAHLTHGTRGGREQATHPWPA